MYLIIKNLTTYFKFNSTYYSYTNNKYYLFILIVKLLFFILIIKTFINKLLFTILKIN